MNKQEADPFGFETLSVELFAKEVTEGTVDQLLPVITEGLEALTDYHQLLTHLTKTDDPIIKWPGRKKILEPRLVQVTKAIEKWNQLNEEYNNDGQK